MGVWTLFAVEPDVEGVVVVKDFHPRVLRGRRAVVRVLLRERVAAAGALPYGFVEAAVDVRWLRRRGPRQVGRRPQRRLRRRRLERENCRGGHEDERTQEAGSSRYRPQIAVAIRQAPLCRRANSKVAFADAVAVRRATLRRAARPALP